MINSEIEQRVADIVNVSLNSTYSFDKGDDLYRTFEHRYHRDIANLMDKEVQTSAYRLLEEIFHMVRLYRENSDSLRSILFGEFDQDPHLLFKMTREEIQNELKYSDRSIQILDMMYQSALEAIRSRSAFRLKVCKSIYLSFINGQYKDREERIVAYYQGQKMLEERRSIIKAHSIYHD